MNASHLTALTSSERAAVQRGRWFSGLPMTARHDMLRLASIDRYSDGEMISDRNAVETAWYACAQGKIRVSASSRNGKPFTTAYVRSGIWFGGAGVFDDGPSTHDLHSVGETTVLSLERSDFQSLLKQSPELCTAVLKLQARHIRDLYDTIESLNSLALGPRLARQLLVLEAAHGQQDINCANTVRIELPLSQGQLAEMVGCSRQRVNLTLREFQSEKLITTSRSFIALHDLEGLRRRAYR